MFLNAPASQIVKIDFRISEKCPLLYTLVKFRADFWPFLAIFDQKRAKAKPEAFELVFLGRLRAV